MIQGFYDEPPVNLDDLDRVLVKVIAHNKDMVISWFKDEAGSWGFLAGKAVSAYRTELGRRLTEKERQILWARLWSLLQTLKAQL